MYNKVRNIYAQAYEWDPPDVYRENPVWTIRHHIKHWINDWDLRRLYPDYSPKIQVIELKQDLSEMLELEEESEGDQSDGVSSTRDDSG